MAKTPTGTQADELRRLMQRLFRSFGALAAESTPCGKPLSIAHAHALMVMLRRGELSQQDLGVELGIDKSNVARLCAKMVEVGHVQQRQSEHDGRSRTVCLTKRGDRLAREVDAASGARFGALLAALPKPRRGPLIEALQHLVAAVDELPDAALDERTPR
jgi:DNA-binding MarR family transcriptional regulator